MQDKYNMTQEQNVFLAKRNIVDSIWKSSHIEGINITFPETREIVLKNLQELNTIECITNRSISIMCYLMRTQFFSDGNKRTAMLFANKIMIQNGKGIISIPVEKDVIFGEELIRYYETNNMENLKKFIYDYCIDGINTEKL